MIEQTIIRVLCGPASVRPRRGAAAFGTNARVGRASYGQRSKNGPRAGMGPNEGRAVLRAHPAVKAAKRPQRLQVQRQGRN